MPSAPRTYSCRFPPRMADSHDFGGSGGGSTKITRTTAMRRRRRAPGEPSSSAPSIVSPYRPLPPEPMDGLSDSEQIQGFNVGWIKLIDRDRNTFCNEVIEHSL